MAAGVPIKAPVAGIAMGLISDGTNYTVLTDIQGLEDHLEETWTLKWPELKDGITRLFKWILKKIQRSYKNKSYVKP